MRREIFFLSHPLLPTMAGYRPALLAGSVEKLRDCHDWIRSESGVLFSAKKVNYFFILETLPQDYRSITFMKC